MKEKAIAVTIGFANAPESSSLADASSELVELSQSAGLSVVKDAIFKQKKPAAPLLIGKGKAELLAEWVQNEKADVVVLGHNLTGTQQRNLEEIVPAKTIDRTQLILDIFAARAHSKEGKLQVEAAQLKYLLPRLTGKGIYLSRLGGGVGTRGPGEQKLEMDRRRIHARLSLLGRELENLQNRRLAGIHRKRERDFPLLALVGYTNAGKSSLFNKLTSASVRVEGRLFSTLDTTTRLLKLPFHQKSLLADTVGFIRHLPPHLVESFKATLEEVLEADILLHVIDASRADQRELEGTVDEILKGLGAGDKKKILIFNKADLLTEEEKELLRKRQNSQRFVLTSALTGEGLEPLLAGIAQDLLPERRRRRLFLPKERFGLLDFLYAEAQVLEREDVPGGCYLTVFITPKVERIFESRLTEG